MRAWKQFNGMFGLRSYRVGLPTSCYNCASENICKKSFFLELENSGPNLISCDSCFLIISYGNLMQNRKYLQDKKNAKNSFFLYSWSFDWNSMKKIAPMPSRISHIIVIRIFHRKTLIKIAKNIYSNYFRIKNLYAALPAEPLLIINFKLYAELPAALDLRTLLVRLWGSGRGYI